MADFRQTRRVNSMGSRQDRIRWRRRMERLDPSGGAGSHLIDDAGNNWLIDDNDEDNILLVQD